MENTVKISKGNAKMGAIASVSLPAITTCRKDCGCCKKCYAHKIERLRPNVRAAYESNFNLLNNDPETYWRGVEAAIMINRFFRFHVSGDIPNDEYLSRMVEIAARNPHCEILCFTKRYGFVNGYLSTGGTIPANLHILFSAWEGLTMENPHNLPEAHVRYRDGKTTAGENAVECSGNCEECAIANKGCWALKEGEQIVFDEH